MYDYIYIYQVRGICHGPDPTRLYVPDIEKELAVLQETEDWKVVRQKAEIFCGMVLDCTHDYPPQKKIYIHLNNSKFQVYGW